MPWAKRQTRPIPPMHSQQRGYELNDYSLGMNSFLSNDKIPTNDSQANFWRLAQDARIPSLGEYETRKGFDYYSNSLGETLGVNQAGSTSPSDAVVSETTWAAEKFVASANARLTKFQVRLKNPSDASGSVSVELWTDSGGSPGTRLARTSIANSSITSSYAYISAYFAQAPDLTNGTSYWVVCHIQLYGGGSYNWSTYTTGSPTAKYSLDAGTTWTAGGYALNFRQYATTNVDGTKGLYRAVKSNGTKNTLLATKTQVLTFDDVTGTPSNVRTGLNASADRYRFATFNDVVYYVNNYDGLRKWDFTTESQVFATNYSLICNHKGLLWLAGGADPNAVVFSNFGLAETFTSTDFVYADVPKNGDPVTALVSLNGSLFVYTKSNKFIISGDNNQTFSVDEAPDQKGTYTQETVCQDNNYMYFLSDDGVYRSNGSEAQLMSKNNFNDIQAIQDKTGCVLTVNQGRLYLWYASAGSANNDRCFVWNLNYTSNGQDCIESLDTDAFVSRATSSPADSNKLIVASSRIDQVFYQGTSSNGYSNLGGDINFELRTNYMTFGSPAQLHAVRYWNPRFATSSTNNTVDCYYAVDLNPNATLVTSLDVQGSGYQWGDGTTWGSGATWGTNSEVAGNFNVPGEYRRIQLRYKHYGARQYVRFLGQSLLVQTRRIR